MGSPGFRIMNLSINTGNSGGVHQPRSNYRGAQMESSLSSAPAIEAGTSMVTVHVSGQIQLE